MVEYKVHRIGLSHISLFDKFCPSFMQFVYKPTE